MYDVIGSREQAAYEEEGKRLAYQNNVSLSGSQIRNPYVWRGLLGELSARSTDLFGDDFTDFTALYHRLTEFEAKALKRSEPGVKVDLETLLPEAEIADDLINQVLRLLDSAKKMAA